MDIGPVFGFRPIQMLGHLGLGIQLDAFHYHPLEFLVAGHVDRMPAALVAALSDHVHSAVDVYGLTRHVPVHREHDDDGTDFVGLAETAYRDELLPRN